MLPILRLYGKSYTIEEAGALAIKEQHLGNFQAAIDIYNLVIAKVPGHAVAYNNQGNALQALRRFDEALASYDKAIALKPDYVEAYNNQGAALEGLERFDDALMSYDKALALKPDIAEIHNNRGAVLQALKRFDEALASYDRAIALKPDYTKSYFNRGNTLLSKGDMEEAEKMFLKALALKPDFPEAMLGLTNIRKYSDADHTDIKNIKILLSRPGILPQDKECLSFSLGKIYDDCGLYDDAFECYRQGNEIRNTYVSYNSDTVTKIADGIINTFSKEVLAEPFAIASNNRSPVFVVGMPRSGTTLMASMLSNHPSIATAGELPTIIGFNLRMPELAKNISSATASRLINDYEKRLRRDAGADIPYVIDKQPLNFWHLGFISMLFPKSHIIHCTRDPLDTCLSNYFQRFALSYDYSFNLRNIAHFYGEYTKIMEHWRKVLPINMIEVNYENMTLNTEQVARKTLDLLGLEWNERCLTPHTNPCAVETASNWQVRQPIYKQSVERWRHYEKHLTSLKEMLQL